MSDEPATESLFQGHYETCAIRSDGPCDCPVSDFPEGFIWDEVEGVPSRAYTARETADALGVVERTVRRWIESGRLPATKERGEFRILMRDARAVMDDSRAGNRRTATHLAIYVEWLEGENARLWALLEKAVSRG